MRGLTINLEAARNVAVILYGKFNSDEGIFGHNVMPEDLLPKWGSSLSSSNIARGSYEHLMFITLVVSIDYQRNADHQLYFLFSTFFEGIIQQEHLMV